MNPIIFKFFFTKYKIENVFTDNDFLFFLYDATSDSILKLKKIVPTPTIYYRDICRISFDEMFYNQSFTTMYIAKVSGEDVIVKWSMDEEFARLGIISPNKSVLLNKSLSRLELKEYYYKILEASLANQDFISINMLAQYFVFTRSNLFRFMDGKLGVLSIKKLEFLTSFLNRPIIDLTFGEIKRLIALNCRNREVLAKIMQDSYNMPLAKFDLIISDIENEYFSVSELKKILYHYQLAIGRCPAKSTQNLNLEYRLEMDQNLSFKDRLRDRKQIDYAKKIETQE